MLRFIIQNLCYLIIAKFVSEHSMVINNGLTFEPRHEISNNMVCATSKGSYQPAHTRLCKSHKYSMNVNLLTEHHLKFLSLKGGCTDSSESLQLSKYHIVGNHMSRLKCSCRWLIC